MHINILTFIDRLIKGVMELTYNQLRKRCGELHLHPCNGTKVAIKAKIDAEEARLANIEAEKIRQREERIRIKAESRTLPVPLELVQYEIISHLGLKDLLAYCETNNAARALCDENQLLEKRLDDASYEELTESVREWFWVGVRLNKALELLKKVVDRLDLSTLQICYYYLMEQGRSKEAEELKSIVLASSNQKKRIGDDKKWFKQTIDQYTQFNDLVGIIRAGAITGQVATKMEEFIESLVIDSGGSSSKYMGELLGSSLNNDELYSFLLSLSEVHRTGLEAWIVDLAGYLKQKGRLTMRLSLLINSLSSYKQIVRIYTPDELDIHGRDYKELVDGPRTIEGLEERLDIGSIALTLPRYFTPSAFIEELRKRPTVAGQIMRHLKINIRNLLKWGYNVWLEELVRLSKKEAFLMNDDYNKQRVEAIDTALKA